MKLYLTAYDSTPEHNSFYIEYDTEKETLNEAINKAKTKHENELQTGEKFKL